MKKNKFLNKINIFNKKKKKNNKINIFNRLFKKEKKVKKQNKINIFGKLFKKQKEDDNLYNFKEVIIIVVFSVCIGVVASLSVVKLLNDGGITIPKSFNKLLETYNTLTNKYYGAVDKDELIDNALSGMLSTFSDPYTTYSDDEETKTFLEKVNGYYNGIGCEVANNSDGDIFIYQVFDNSPASTAGLKKDDIIISIDGVSYHGKTSSDMSNYVKNKKSNEIKMIIKREEEEKEITVKLKKVEIPSIETNIYEKNNKKIGYLAISIFSSITDKQFESKLKELENKGIDGLVIDVRQNTGGYLNVVTNIANSLLPKGKIIYQLEDNDGITKKYATSKEKREYKIAVLTDVVSASASEILASAIKESYKGYVVGTRTFGKGTVQQTYDLSDGSMIKYTIQKWLTPDGNWIDGEGVEPTHEVELNEEYFKNPSMDTDNQFQKALELVSE